MQHVPILHEVSGGQLLAGAHWQIAFWFDGHTGSNDNRQHAPTAVQPNPGGQSTPRSHRWYARAPFGQSGKGSKQQPRPGITYNKWSKFFISKDRLFCECINPNVNKMQRSGIAKTLHLEAHDVKIMRNAMNRNRNIRKS